MSQGELSHWAGPGGWLPLSDGKEVHSLVAPRGNPAPEGPGPPWLCCGPTLMLLQMLGLKCSARKAAGRSLAETRPPWGTGLVKGAKLPYAEWAPRWPGSLGLAPTPRPSGHVSC